jgi:hypothetical protein
MVRKIFSGPIYSIPAVVPRESADLSKFYVVLALTPAATFSKTKFVAMCCYDCKPRVLPAGRVRTAFILVISFALFAPSCRRAPAAKEAHYVYFDPVYLKVDSMDPDHKDRALAYLDSVYAAFPNSAPEDLYRKYDYHRHYFYETKKDYPSAMVYVDSAIRLVRDLADRQPFIEEYGHQ